MATVIACPFCQRSLQLPEEALARSVKCPGCGGEFDTGRSATTVAAQRPTLIVEEAENLPLPIRGLPPLPGQLRPVLVSSTHDDGPLPPRRDYDAPRGLQRCRTCQARLTHGTAACPACGSAVRTDDERPWEQAGGPLRRDCEPHRGPLLVTLGRLALCIAVPGLLGLAYFPFALASLLAIGLGLTISIMARDDLEQMRRKEMDPEGEVSTMGGQTAASVGFITGLIGLVLAALLRLPLFFG